MRAADWASPVESTEGERRENETERRGIGHLLRQTDQRSSGGRDETEEHQQNGHGQLASTEGPVRAQDLAAYGLVALLTERRSPKWRREERSTEERQVAIDSGDPDEPRDPAERKSELLRTYWSIPERQIETSVVLAGPAVEPG